MLKAFPGIVIIEPLDTKSNAIYDGKPKFQKIKKGKVIAIGNDLTTDFNALIKMADYAKVEDVVWFLSYDEEFDQITEGNKKYFLVKVQDLRGVIK